MGWGLFLAVVWGGAATCAWSHLAGPVRRWLVAQLTALESVIAGASPPNGEDSSPRWWTAWGSPWLSKGPDCPACVAFWIGAALSAAGHGPAGVPWWQAALAAYGVVLAASAILERIAPESW